PVIGQAPSGASEPKAIAAIVVDCSASMALDEGGRTRMDLLRSAVLQILSSLNKDDEAALVMAGTSQRAGSAAATADLETLAMRGVPNRLLVRIRDYGDQPRVNLPVTVSIDERELAKQTVNLSPGATVAVEAPVTFSAAGSQIVTAAIRSRGLAGDDRLDYAV